MSRSRGPVPVRSATRCPARPKAAPSTHRVSKPSLSSSSRRMPPTCRTPAKFIVPLLMFTSRSSNARPSALRGPTASAIARSVASRGAGAAATGSGKFVARGVHATAAIQREAAITRGERVNDEVIGIGFLVRQCPAKLMVAPLINGRSFGSCRALAPLMIPTRL